VSVSAQEYKTLPDGIEYAEIERAIDEKPVRMNLLRLDLKKVRLDVVHAMDAAIGLEKTSSIAARHGAFAAINAGFFRLDASMFAGDAAGALMIDGKLLSESYSDRASLIINNGGLKTNAHITRLRYSATIFIDRQKFEITGFNRERKENDLIIYTPEFHLTTLTDNKGIEIGVQGNKIKRIFPGAGSTKIAPFSYIISASGKYQEQLEKMSLYNRAATINRIVDAFGFKEYINWTRVEDIVGGVPQLIKNGKIDITWQPEKSSKAFVETRHPRTAVAKLKDEKFLMITVDGRSEASAGINLEDLAKLLLEFGATDAMNLDGGGSTTMFVDGKVVNKPSDKEGERRVSDALLVFPRRKIKYPAAS
jgi:hypothetical protein